MILTTIFVAAGLQLAHAVGVGLVLKVIPGAPVTGAALAAVEAHILPAVIAWEQGPIVSDGDGELYYPIVGWFDTKEANG